MDRLDASLRAELGRFGPQGAIGELVAAWPTVVGEQIAANAWPARLARDGTLNVAASSSAWAFELGQLAPAILERLREALGPAAPRALRFAVGPLPQRAAPGPREAAPPPPAPGPRERAEAELLVAGLEDAELRSLVARAAAASLARPPRGRRV